MERLGTINENAGEERDPSHGGRRRIMIFLAAVGLAGAVLLCVAASAAKGMPEGMSARIRAGAGQEDAATVSLKPEVREAADVLAGIAETCQYPEGQGYAAPHKITEPVKLSDIYTVSGNTVLLQCYYPEAGSYTWEVHNRHTGGWEAMEGETRQDELGRPVSALGIAAEGTDIMQVRCTVRMGDGSTVTENASIHMIPEILDVAVEEESFVTEAGRYLSGREIPVRVSYTNGTQDVITGLYGITFVKKTEKKEITADGAGNPVETVTTVYTEHNYAYIGLEDREFVLRYRNGEQQVTDMIMTVSGKDLRAPVISDVIVDGFEITNVDAPVTVHVEITAEDDKTPCPDLEYAFIPKDPEADDTVPDDRDWTQEAAFDLEITQNGIWTAFCRDQGGNTASMEKEIIVVDQKPPVLSLRLADTGWCSSTRLSADAEDHLPVEYRVIAPDGTDSGWTAQKEYEVKCNGKWEVQARDSVGNVSSENITVTNIDRQPPVIEKSTAEKNTPSPAEGGRNSNEN